ncbi:MAG: cupredoxin domain-containing protein [Bacteroidia bacterium]
MRALTLLFFSFAILCAGGCTKEPKGNPGPNEVWLEYKAFNPIQLTVTAGTTVSFINKDNSNHSATSTGNFDSGRIKSGDTYKYTFTTPGVYYFYCSYHSGSSSEQGAIKVQ